MRTVKSKYLAISFLLIFIVCGVVRLLIPWGMQLSYHSKRLLELNIGANKYHDLYYHTDETIVNEYFHWFDTYQIALKPLTMHKKVGSLRIEHNRETIRKQFQDIIIFFQANQELTHISSLFSKCLKDSTYQISQTLSNNFLLRFTEAEINQKQFIDKEKLVYSLIEGYETKYHKEILKAEACRDFMDSEELINYIISIDDLNMSIYEIIKDIHDNSLNN